MPVIHEGSESGDANISVQLSLLLSSLGLNSVSETDGYKIATRRGPWNDNSLSGSAFDRHTSCLHPSSLSRLPGCRPPNPRR